MFLARVQRSRRLWKFNIDSHGNSERCIPAIIIETNKVDEIEIALTPSVKNKEGRKVKKNDYKKLYKSRKEPYVTPIENIQNLWKAVLCEYVERVNELTGYYERATSPLLKSKHKHELILERRWLESSNEKPGSFIWICYALDIDLNKTRNNLEKLFEVLN